MQKFILENNLKPRQYIASAVILKNDEDTGVQVEHKNGMIDF